MIEWIADGQCDAPATIGRACRIVVMVVGAHIVLPEVTEFRL